MRRLILKFPKKPPKNPFFFNPFSSYATVAAAVEVPTNDAASSAIFTRLINFNYRDKRGLLKRFLGHDPELKTLISSLIVPEIDGIIGKLRIEYPETALDFFFLLKNEYGFKHSRVSYFFIANILAKKERFRALKLHLLQMVQQEGSTILTL